MKNQMDENMDSELETGFSLLELIGAPTSIQGAVCFLSIVVSTGFQEGRNWCHVLSMLFSFFVESRLHLLARGFRVQRGVLCKGWEAFRSL